MKQNLINMGLLIIVMELNSALCRTLQGGATSMSSVFNNYNPELAIDGNPNTCAQTGFGTHSWWKVDLNQTRTVNSVTVYAPMDLPTIKIRVGDYQEDNGAMEGHEKNTPCTNWPFGPVPLSASGGYTFNCGKGGAAGRYLSIETSTTKMDSSDLYLQVCEVTADF